MIFVERLKGNYSDRVQIKEKVDFLDTILGRDTGPTWKEVNIALGQTMQDYAGASRSETLLQAGLNHLRRLKEKANNTMIAQNLHELMHCLEVMNLFDIGELVFLASRERKETRGNYIRLDHPYTNIKKVHNKPVFEWRQAKR